MSDTPDNVLSLSDHRDPTIVQVTIVCNWDGTSQHYIQGVDMTNERTRTLIAEELEALTAKIRDDNRTPTPVDAGDVPA